MAKERFRTTPFSVHHTKNILKIRCVKGQHGVTDTACVQAYDMMHGPHVQSIMDCTEE